VALPPSSGLNLHQLVRLREVEKHECVGLETSNDEVGGGEEVEVSKGGGEGYVGVEGKF